MHTGFIVPLAWPETKCKQAGAWYDSLMYLFGFNKNGYYKVGHAALLLVDLKEGVCKYFDFGRYHAPYGYGRVRDGDTDHDLKVNTKALFSIDYKQIINLREILQELRSNTSTHGDGYICGSPLIIDYTKAFNKILKFQKREFVPYGPFTLRGTNCSRFVLSVMKAGVSSFSKKVIVSFPHTLTPTVMWNLISTGEQIMKVD